jgi:hypothetical protein
MKRPNKKRAERKESQRKQKMLRFKNLFLRKTIKLLPIQNPNHLKKFKLQKAKNQRKKRFSKLSKFNLL